MIYGRSPIAMNRCQTDNTYRYGKIRCMKKTLNIEQSLLDEAKAACGATTDTETVRLGLESLVKQAAYERLATLLGTEPSAVDVPRRREPAVPSDKPLL